MLTSAPRRLCAPSSVRLRASLIASILASLLAGLLFAAPAAQGGTYIGANTIAVPNSNPVTYTQSPYSGGTHAVPGPNNTVITPADASSAQGYGGASGGITASCTGAITASWTWVPAPSMTMTTDPPPTSVIVTESCTASVTVATPIAAGKYDTGMGKSGGVSWSPGGNNTAEATVIRYSVQTGGATLTLPVVSATASAASPGDTCSVYYTATLYPITVNIIGTNNPSAGDYRALTGQQITANLTATYGLPYGTKVTGYTWAGVSGTCFKTYNETASSNQLVALGSSDLTGPASGSTSVASLAFYDSAAENLTLTCTVSVAAPDGTSLSLTATSPPINVLKPTLTGWGIAEGYLQLASNGSAYGLYGNLSGTGNSTNGMIWSNVTVNVPAPFSGNGQCTFTQLVNPNRIAYVSGVSKPQVPYNGILGIDGSFNYGSSWGVTGTGNDVDSPNQPLYYTAGLTEFSDADAFTTYVMYQPSGGVWVPLEKISWTWSVTLDWQTQTSQFSLTAGYPHTAGQAGTPAHVPTTDPPQWTVIHPSQ